MSIDGNTAGITAVKRKVLVCGHDQKFWYPLQSHLEATGLFEFKEDYWPGHNEHDPKKTLELMAWADIVVAEWALGNAVFCSKHKKPGQRLITRLHLQERNTSYPAHIDYKKIDAVVFVGRHILEECVQKFAIPQNKARVIGNFLDWSRFQHAKMGGNEFNLGMIGIVPARKRVDLALDTLEILLEKDDRYSLHIKGPSPDSYPWLMARTLEREYYTKVYERINGGYLRHKVIFDPAGEDVHHWFRKIGFLLSPSDFESFHMAVAEGMCARTIPIVWAWEGANDIYPFVPLADSADSAAKAIEFMRKSRTGERLAEQACSFISGTYSADVIRDQWVDLLLGDVENTRHISSSEKRNCTIVVWAIDRWSTFHRREMLEALARNSTNDFNFLIIEPGNHYSSLLKADASLEQELKLFATLKPVSVSENVQRIRLITGGFPEELSVDPILRENLSYGEMARRIVARMHGPQCQVINWIYKPNQRNHLGQDARYVYEVYDEYTADFGTGVIYPEVAQLEPTVLRDADQVFFTSQPLAERKKAYAKSWSLVGNGVVFDTFAKYRCNSSPSAGKRKAVGYLGNLSDFFDWELMTAVCSQMPEVDFIFNGQVEKHKLTGTQFERLAELPNVFFSGRVSRAIGAAAVARYDAAIIPFVVNDAMHAVEPLKLWEYFATGKPVVSSPMNAVTVPKPLLRVASTRTEWVDAIIEALEEDPDDEVREARIRLAQRRSWNTITLQHWETLKAIAGDK